MRDQSATAAGPVGRHPSKVFGETRRPPRQGHRPLRPHRTTAKGGPAAHATTGSPIPLARSAVRSRVVAVDAVRPSRSRSRALSQRSTCPTLLRAILAEPLTEVQIRRLIRHQLGVGSIIAPVLSLGCNEPQWPSPRHGGIAWPPPPTTVYHHSELIDPNLLDQRLDQVRTPQT